MAALVLIIDDEHDLVAALDYALKREGFETRTAYDGASALDAAATRPLPDLILLDWMLPDIPGTEVFRQLRRTPLTAGIPVMMVSARGEEFDRIVGLELGADDYIVKPFSTRELILRARAVLRRSQAPPPTVPGQATGIDHGPIRMDPTAHRVWVHGDEVHLTVLEFRLLEALLGRPGQVFTRELLLERAWEDGVHVSERTVDVHVKRLRKKLGKAGAAVETVRGVGYRLGAPETE